MLCPNCGTRTTAEHKFCRACGMNLEPVSKALAEHLAGDRARAASARAAERGSMRRITTGLVAGFALTLLGLLFMTMFPGKGPRTVGLLVALVGLVGALLFVLSPLRSTGDGAATPAPPTLDPSAAETGRLLREQTAEPLPSVTERTTELLEVEGREPRA